MSKKNKKNQNEEAQAAQDQVKDNEALNDAANQQENEQETEAQDPAKTISDLQEQLEHEKKE